MTFFQESHKIWGQLGTDSYTPKPRHIYQLVRMLSCPSLPCQSHSQYIFCSMLAQGTDVKQNDATKQHATSPASPQSFDRQLSPRTPRKTKDKACLPGSSGSPVKQWFREREIWKLNPWLEGPGREALQYCEQSGGTTGCLWACYSSTHIAWAIIK